MTQSTTRRRDLCRRRGCENFIPVCFYFGSADIQHDEAGIGSSSVWYLYGSFHFLGQAVSRFPLYTCWDQIKLWRLRHAMLVTCGSSTQPSQWPQDRESSLVIKRQLVGSVNHTNCRHANNQMKPAQEQWDKNKKDKQTSMPCMAVPALYPNQTRGGSAGLGMRGGTGGREGGTVDEFCSPTSVLTTDKPDHEVLKRETSRTLLQTKTHFRLPYVCP